MYCCTGSHKETEAEADWFAADAGNAGNAAGSFLPQHANLAVHFVECAD
jgi:hypothetical protein